MRLNNVHTVSARSPCSTAFPSNARRNLGPVLGSSGAGKTTLLNLLLGLFKPKSGTVRSPRPHAPQTRPQAAPASRLRARHPGRLRLDDARETSTVSWRPNTAPGTQPRWTRTSNACRCPWTSASATSPAARR
ncbi:MAG: ATP-binding cassette domain-containing protein [Planctomycetota bacterium]